MQSISSIYDFEVCPRMTESAKKQQAINLSFKTTKQVAQSNLPTGIKTKKLLQSESNVVSKLTKVNKASVLSQVQTTVKPKLNYEELVSENLALREENSSLEKRLNFATAKYNQVKKENKMLT